MEQASFTVQMFDKADRRLWEDSAFREGMAMGMGSITNPTATPEQRADEQQRLKDLFNTSHVTEMMRSGSPEERTQLAIFLMETPAMTASLLNEHHGNFGTATAYLQLQGLTENLTGPFINGTVPPGMIAPETQLNPPNEQILQNHPHLAALGTPITTQKIEDAIRQGELTPQQAAAYIRDIASYAQQRADTDLGQYGASPFVSAAIHLLGGGNPIEKTNLDDYAGLQADSLYALADAIAGSTDPAFISQAMVAGSLQDNIFRQSLEPYAQAISAQGELVERNRQFAIAGAGIVASLAAPAAAAALFPAGTTVTLGGLTIGSTGLQAMTGAGVNMIVNIANQQAQNGYVDWLQVGANTFMSGISAYLGAKLLNALPAQYKTQLVEMGVDGFGAAVTHLLTTPEAWEKIQSGDVEAFAQFLLDVGVNVVGSQLAP
jgi:hypothetical protein